MSNATIGNIDVYFEVHGRGAPLVLIAGLASDSQSWQPIVEDLARRYTVIIFDNRGVGRTTPLDTDISIRQLSDDAMSLIRHLGYSSAALLGHSMGGFIAMDCAIRYPECVDKLILAGTSTHSSKRNVSLFSDWASCLESGMDPALWFKSIFYWIFTARFFENEEAVEDVIRFELDYPYPINKLAFRKQVKAASDFNCREEVSRIRAKTLIVAGEEDLLFSPEECVRLSEAIPGAEYCLVKRAAHSIFMENPGDFTACVLGFLSRRE